LSSTARLQGYTNRVPVTAPKHQVPTYRPSTNDRYSSGPWWTGAPKHQGPVQLYRVTVQLTSTKDIVVRDAMQYGTRASFIALNRPQRILRSRGPNSLHGDEPLPFANHLSECTHPQTQKSHESGLRILGMKWIHERDLTGSGSTQTVAPEKGTLNREP
jgi:hypothetical protein